jgi:mRNA-degrading endonuclease RelE of RelBE toxin-antitoxin system
MIWIVHIHDGAAKQLKAIPPDRRQRVLDDIDAFKEDPFRGSKKRTTEYRKISGRYRIILKPMHPMQMVDVLAVLLHNEKTYR